MIQLTFSRIEDVFYKVFEIDIERHADQKSNCHFMEILKSIRRQFPQLFRTHINLKMIVYFYYFKFKKMVYNETLIDSQCFIYTGDFVLQNFNLAR